MSLHKIASVTVLILFTCISLFSQENDLEISDSDLTKFSSVFDHLREMDQEIQEKMKTVVCEENMEIQRFNKAYTKELDPEKEPVLSEEEKKKFDQIVLEIENMQIDFQKKIEKTIKASGLEVEKYQQIATRLQIDPDLQERLRNLARE